ncbi:MAG: hypothetical protein CL607_03705 [Anaerolineaceae bacterium]|nr:hypothetical protein [Anaerolineaceae bacterium]
MSETFNISPNDYINNIYEGRIRRTVQVIAVAGLLVILSSLLFSIQSGFDQHNLLMAGLILFGSCIAAWLLVNRGNQNLSTWVLLLGIFTSLSGNILLGDVLDQQISLLLFPVAIILASQMLTPSDQWNFAFLCIAAIIGVPLIAELGDAIAPYQVASAGLTLLAAAIHTRMMAFIDDIIQWSLANYEREKGSNGEINEKRDLLQKGLEENERMAVTLQKINDDLAQTRESVENARHFRGQFLANMSHELRTPLNAIIGFSETMLRFPIMYEDQELPDLYERDLSHIQSSGQHLLQVINNILDLSKIDAGKFELGQRPFTPMNAIKQTVQFAKAKVADKPIEVHYNGPDTLPQFLGDEERLLQVLMHITDNAVKYTDSGHITISASTHDDMLEIAIADTGRGVPEDMRDTLFEEFQQAHRNSRDERDGSGLGLALANMLVELMQGQLTFESEAGKGSTFTVAMPIYTTSAIDGDTEPPPTTAAEVGNEVDATISADNEDKTETIETEMVDTEKVITT